MDFFLSRMYWRISCNRCRNLRSLEVSASSNLRGCVMSAGRHRDGARRKREIVPSYAESELSRGRLTVVNQKARTVLTTFMYWSRSAGLVMKQLACWS